jgi:hypothetical protein
VLRLTTTRHEMQASSPTRGNVARLGKLMCIAWTVSQRASEVRERHRKRKEANSRLEVLLCVRTARVDQRNAAS